MVRSGRLIGVAFAGALVAALTLQVPAVAGTRTEPSFKANCDYTHSANNDPIVFPGQPGKSHLHDFFGSVATDASSTASSIAVAPTSCDFTDDKSAYWTPALLQNGTPVAPDHVAAYYKVDGSDPAAVQPMPFGLSMIVGDAHATAPQPTNMVGWLCSPDSTAADNGPTSAAIPTCAADQHLSLRLVYPQCWDGVNLDSPDHKSHMAFLGKAAACPADHPVLLPTLHQIVHYDGIRGGPEFTLASGGQLTGHADFINAWEPGLMAQLVDMCLHQQQVCRASGVVPDGGSGPVEAVAPPVLEESVAAPLPPPVAETTVPTTLVTTTCTLPIAPGAGPAPDATAGAEQAAPPIAVNDSGGSPLPWIAGAGGGLVLVAGAALMRRRRLAPI